MFSRAVRAYIRRILHLDKDSRMLEIAIRNGLKIGKDCNIQTGCIIDPSHCWLIEIGDRCTFAPHVHILAHDASTKRPLGMTRLGRVEIGNDVFVGAGTIILPNVKIGNKVVIGAGSVVSRDIPENSVALGCPARVICTYDEYIYKKEEELKTKPCFDFSYTYNEITLERKKEMIDALKKERVGYIV